MRRLLTFAFASSLVTLAACKGGDGPSVPELKVLSPEGEQRSGLSVSPDGKHVAYWEPAGEVGGEYQLWMANADLSSTVQLPFRGFSFPAAWSPDGTKLLATALNGSIVVVPVSGGQPKAVTPANEYQTHIMFHPDGDHFLYTAYRKNGTYGMEVGSLSTGERRDALRGELRPYNGAWSPDGKHLAYEVFEKGRSTIWLADGDGANPRQLTTEGFEGAGYPYPTMWSPDSKEIVYHSMRTGTNDIWVIPIDGGKPRQLTRDVRKDIWPNWSSDGKWIAFASNRGHQVDVWVVPSRGGPEIRVTDDLAEEDRSGEGPRWIPGTHTLLFAAVTSSRSLWSIQSDGTGALRLTDNAVRAHAVSPDGKQIAFVDQHPGNIHDLKLIPVTGGPARTLVAGGGAVTNPVWSPDGKYIAFFSNREGERHLFVIPSSGGVPKRVTAGREAEYSGTWGGTDTSLYFLSGKESRYVDVWKTYPNASHPTRLTTDGTFGTLIYARPGTSVILAGRVKDGHWGIYRFTDDGSTHAIWDRSLAFLESVSPKGDSVIVGTQRPDGKSQPMMFGINGGEGRALGSLNQFFVDWSNDGRMATYAIRRNGKNQIGVYDFAGATSKVLTTGTDEVWDPYFTADGSKIIYRTNNTTIRIEKVDLSKALSAAEKEH